MTQINGTVADGFGAVADAFERNFTEFDEVGAAFSLYVDGDEKVDIWAGTADKATGRAWNEDTLQLVFSTTKGAAAICVARLVEAGSISYDDTVATYWPEFAANGKEHITIGQMMSHQAGLPYVDASALVRRSDGGRSDRRSARRPDAALGTGIPSRLSRTSRMAGSRASSYVASTAAASGSTSRTKSLLRSVSISGSACPNRAASTPRTPPPVEPPGYAGARALSGSGESGGTIDATAAIERIRFV